MEEKYKQTRKWLLDNEWYEAIKIFDKFDHAKEHYYQQMLDDYAAYKAINARYSGRLRDLRRAFLQEMLLDNRRDFAKRQGDLIDTLKKEKESELQQELNRMANLHEEIEKFLNYEPSLLEKLKNKLSYNDTFSDTFPISLYKKGYEHIKINISIYCDEVLNALLEYYEKRIIEIHKELT